MRNTLKRKQISQTDVKFLERKDNGDCMTEKRLLPNPEKVTYRPEC